MFILDELFCSVDGFCLIFEPNWNKQLLENGKRYRIRKRTLAIE